MRLGDTLPTLEVIYSHYYREVSSIWTVVLNVENNGWMAVASVIECTALTVGEYTGAILFAVGLW